MKNLISIWRGGINRMFNTRQNEKSVYNRKIQKRISFTIIIVLLALAILFPHYYKPPINPYDLWWHTERFFVFGDKPEGYNFDLYRTWAELSYSILAGLVTPFLSTIIGGMFSYLRRIILLQKI